MMLKIRIIAGLIILVILSIYYFGIRPGSSSEMEISNLPWRKITAIEVSDRGIFGNTIFKITNPDSVVQFCNLIRSSKEINFNAVNFKSSNGLCEIYLLYNDGRKSPLVLTKTASGGILSSGDYLYCNDYLMETISAKLKMNYKKEIPAKK